MTPCSLGGRAMIEVRNQRLPLDAGLESGEGRSRRLVRMAARALKVRDSQIAGVRVLKRSVDARRKRDVHFVMTLGVDLADGLDSENSLVSNLGNRDVVMRAAPATFVIEQVGERSEARLRERPVVVGTGPAGLFASLALARAGLEPLVIERGQDVDARTKAVARFVATGELDPDCNVQFGEGGAGTFSDGKLTTNAHNPLVRTALEWFVQAGAPEQILWEAQPHIGTDRLVQVVRAMRQEIRRLGGEVRFGCRLADVRFDSNGEVAGVVVESTCDGQAHTDVATRDVILATGHSARDTFEQLKTLGVAMERKPFAIGVRIEHPQKTVNRAQWGAAAGHPALGAASYKLACHLKGGRSVFTFCMCPGGEVIPAASELGGVVTNGMSRFARDGRNANAGLLVNVGPDDVAPMSDSAGAGSATEDATGCPVCDADDPLAGMYFQRHWEQAAFALAGGTYAAPAQLVGDLLARRASTGPGDVRPSYARGVTWAGLDGCLPAFVTDSIRQALPVFDRKLHGFARRDAVLTGVETRSSSPVRVLRGEDFQAIGHPGLYPCGEGAGYAGGIMTAAVDGLRVAQALVANATSRRDRRGI